MTTMTEDTAKYGFYDRLTADFPSQVNVDVTEVCNLACIHCPHPAFKEGPYYSGAMLDPELNAKMVDEVRDHGKETTGYIRYTSEGEPLAHKQIFEMLEDAARRSGTTVSLTTNGTLMSGSRLDKLLETGIHLVDISLDALTPETYARIRVGGDLVKVRQNVLDLIARARAMKNGPKVVVSYVEQPLNVGETSDFDKFWNDAGADYVVVRRLHSCAGFVEAQANALREAATERRPCLYPWERIVLNPRGFLSFCPADWTKGATVADYRTTTIKEAWQGPFYTGLREAHLKNDYKKYKFCGQCPDWQATRWPDQGRAYANMIEDFKARE